MIETPAFLEKTFPQFLQTLNSLIDINNQLRIFNLFNIMKKLNSDNS
jgi:hypothetical protein